MDTSITILIIGTIIQAVISIITLISVIFIFKTIMSNEQINKNNLFNEIVKQERELKIKLLEYRDIINNSKINNIKRNETKLDYDTLLFNYYEFLSICIYQNLINEKESKLFFKEPIKSVREIFDSSILFKEGYAKKEQYKALQWLFKKWNIQ